MFIVRRQVDYSSFLYAHTTLKFRCIYDLNMGGVIPDKRYILD
jgi:hypothetical protein